MYKYFDMSLYGPFKTHAYRACNTKTTKNPVTNIAH